MPGGKIGAGTFGGRLADIEGEVEFEAPPFEPIAEICIFSGRFNLLMLVACHDSVLECEVLGYDNKRLPLQSHA